LKNKIKDKFEYFETKATPEFEYLQNNLYNLLEFRDYDLVLEWGIFDH